MDTVVQDGDGGTGCGLSPAMGGVGSPKDAMGALEQDLAPAIEPHINNFPLALGCLERDICTFEASNLRDRLKTGGSL